jgi:hypothetical protein
VLTSLAELDLDALRLILLSSYLRPCGEICVWEAILEWIKGDESREVFLENLFKSAVRPGLLSLSDVSKVSQDLKDIFHIDSSPLLTESQDIQLWKHVDDDSAPEAPPLDKLPAPRIPKECILATGGWTVHAPSNEIDLYDPANDTWYSLTTSTLPQPISYHACNVLSGKVYVVGGYDGQSTVKSAHCLDLTTLEWKTLSPMHLSRRFITSAVVNGRIYVMGGCGQMQHSSRHRICERYDPDENQWRRVADMIAVRSDMGAAVHNTKIIVVGGFNGSDYLNSAEMYDPSTNRWRSLPNMRSPRGGVGCAVLDGMLYVIGGNNGLHRGVIHQFQRIIPNSDS